MRYEHEGDRKMYARDWWYDIREKWAWHGHARVGRNGFGGYLGNVMKGAWCGDEREKVVRKKMKA